MERTFGGMLFKDGKASGGTKQVIYVRCLMKRDRVVML